jgi:hypothetical protein
MKTSKLLMIASVFVGILSMPALYAAQTPEQSLAQCKADAEKDEVAASDMRTYLRECLDEFGVAAADAEKLVDQALGGGGKKE